MGSFAWDRSTDTVTAAPSPGLSPSVSSDGRRILYSSWWSDVPAGGGTHLMWDRSTGSLGRMAGGATFAGTLSGDGRHVVAGDSFVEPDLYVWELLE